MAMPALVPRRWTASDVHALPHVPGTRYECVDGELLVTPSPKLPHQLVLFDLARVLDAYVRGAGVGAVMIAPHDLVLDPFTLVQPDVYVMPLVDGRRPRTDVEVGAPLLLVEVLSPTSARTDRVVKRERYQRHGVEYWIVDVEARLIERWSPASEQPEVWVDAVVWLPAGASSALTIELPPLFADALGPIARALPPVPDSQNTE